MDLRKLSLAALLCAALGFAACGDGADDDAEPTTDASASTTPGDIARFGSPPELDGNVKEVVPSHAASVRQATTRAPDQSVQKGVCADVTFADLPGQDTVRWFRMVVDEVEVTEALFWRVYADRSGGYFCFGTADGLSLGEHSAAIAITDPMNFNAQPLKIVDWKFEVTE